MNILILGGGGREHALAWAVKQNPKCDRLIVAPGNAGIARIADCPALEIEDGAAVVDFAATHSIDLVIIGPEAPLAAGVADDLRAAGVSVFGPSAAAARLEASKAFTKEICDACGAPTAAYARFTETGAAREYIKTQGAPIVIKADGLAAGKGVIVAMDEATAAAYRESLRAYYAYRMAGYDHRLRVFEWQNLSTKIIFVVVLLLVFLGIYFAAIQFHVGLRRRGPDGHPPPHEESSEIALSFKGLRIRSPVLGVIVLTISLAFFYLYLVYVYPIETVF